MVKIKAVVDAIDLCLEQKARLADCRQSGQGDIEFFAQGLTKDLASAKAALESALDAYIDDRINSRSGTVSRIQDPLVK